MTKARSNSDDVKWEVKGVSDKEVIGEGEVIATRPASVDLFIEGLQHSNVLYLHLWTEKNI